MKMLLRIIGFCLGAVVGWYIAAYSAPNFLRSFNFNPDSAAKEIGVVIASILVIALFRLLNYFFTDENNAGIDTYLTGTFCAFIAGMVYSWIF
jgi:hypothetical protein